VDAQGVADWGSLTLAILTHGEGPLRLEIEREGRIVHAEVTPREDTAEEGRGGAKRLKRIGIRPSREYRIEKLAPLAALAESARTVAATTALTCRVLGGLVTGEISVRNIAGPVGIVAIAGETAKEGILSLLNLTALLSVNLAVINLLPIPALDGGHLLFILIETLRRKALDRKLEERITQAGFSVLIVLMVLIVLNDFQNFDVIGRIRGVFGR
jgi:regulator of sigma E protease